jgi:exosortase C (VPDSG-CTERM-specific)
MERPNSIPMSGAPDYAPQGRAIFSNRRFQKFLAFTALLLVFFGWPLVNLARFSIHAELYSHILLVPFISGYLWWIKRTEPKSGFQSNPGLALVSFLAAASVLGIYWLAVKRGFEAEKPDTLAATTLSFLLFWLGGAFLFLGSKFLRSLAFLVGFLFFMVPFPMVVRRAIEWFFQHGSADVAYVFLKLSGMPVLRNGTSFLLPGIPISVARECSGIHSSLILFITSLVASYMFLGKSRHRWILVLATIPLAFLRNGFRIFFIAQLCVHFGPQMIDSIYHKQGGPIFFVLSLIPLFLLLLHLTKRELRNAKTAEVRPKE